MRAGATWVIAAAMMLAGCGGTDDASEASDAGGYGAFEDVNPELHGFFISLEDAGADPVTYAGGLEATETEQQFLWNMGTQFCEDLDSGAEMPVAFEDLEENSNLGVESGSVAGSAVAQLCPDHESVAQEWVDENS